MTDNAIKDVLRNWRSKGERQFFFNQYESEYILFDARSSATFRLDALSFHILYVLSSDSFGAAFQNKTLKTEEDFSLAAYNQGVNFEQALLSRLELLSELGLVETD